MEVFKIPTCKFVSFSLLLETIISTLIDSKVSNVVEFSLKLLLDFKYSDVGFQFAQFFQRMDQIYFFYIFMQKPYFNLFFRKYIKTISIFFSKQKFVEKTTPKRKNVSNWNNYNYKVGKMNHMKKR